MFGIRFIKFDSMTYVISFKKGKQNREGRGLAFHYHAPTTSISAVPLGSRDIQFIFQNTTADFQAVSVQGQITYKIENPKQIAEKKMEAQVATAQNERKLRQIKIEADIAIEKERTSLIDMTSANERKDAETRAFVLDATLKPYRDFDWKVLMAMGAHGSDPQANIALAFRELAEKAEKVGNLSITPELLDSLIRRTPNK